MADDPRHYMDYTGCGNTLNMMHPRVLQLIMDSLRYWIQEMHVVGFRFDLAFALARELHDVDRGGSLPRHAAARPVSESIASWLVEWARYSWEATAMMTIVTHVTLKEGGEPEWDAVMRERLFAARGRPGWVGGQLLIPLDGRNRRLIVGTWQSRADWEAWHRDPTFTETRKRLEGLEADDKRYWWHEVIAEVRKE